MSKKKLRQELLIEKIQKDPFLTDEQLSKEFGVSVPTIRLDRLELGIPELRQRVNLVAKEGNKEVKSLEKKDIVGEIIHLQLGDNAISIFNTTEQMCFSKNDIVRGHFIYSLAESLAIAVIDTDVAVVGVANIKYKQSVGASQRLVAKAQLRRQRGSSFFVWVNIYKESVEVFRGKFILVSV